MDHEVTQMRFTANITAPPRCCGKTFATFAARSSTGDRRAVGKPLLPGCSCASSLAEQWTANSPVLCLVVIDPHQQQKSHRHRVLPDKDTNLDRTSSAPTESLKKLLISSTESLNCSTASMWLLLPTEPSDPSSLLALSLLGMSLVLRNIGTVERGQEISAHDESQFQIPHNMQRCVRGPYRKCMQIAWLSANFVLACY